MKTINLRSRIGRDGILNLKVPTTEKEVDVEVVIILQPKNNSKRLWPENFFENTYGCLRNDQIERLPQGDFPQREQLL
ncbi:MAG TPA: hypothetical protein P5123_07290 [Spirochaetota bacterium]|nr:hypothetical protein [Spirochaetota bacterium]